MDLSSDLPCKVRAVREFITGGQSLSMNVLREADREFRLDLKEGRPKRWAKLDAELQRDFYHRLREKPVKAA